MSIKILSSKEYSRDMELNRILNELGYIKLENQFIDIKGFCRRIIKKGDPLLEKRLFYACYKGKKGKLINIKKQTNRKLVVVNQELSYELI